MNYKTQKFFLELQQLFTDLNKGIDFVIAFFIFLACYIVFKLIIKKTIKFLEHKKNNKLKSISIYLELTKSFFIFFLSIVIATHFITLTPYITSFFLKLTEISFIIQLGIWTSYFLRHWIEESVKKKSKENPTLKNALSLFRLSGKVLVWGIVAIILLESLGFQITGLLAGLGIGGIAIGLASQKILSDLFASVSIIMDNPFAVGDKIKFGEFIGRVEYIGLKTTHLRSSSGELIVCSNADLIATRIKNYQRITDLRIDQQLTITADTPFDTLKEVPKFLKQIIEQSPPSVFYESYFSNYNQSGLVFTLSYIIPNAYIINEGQIKETVNYKIYELFQEKKIRFSYPTQRLLFEGEMNTIKAMTQNKEQTQEIIPPVKA